MSKLRVLIALLFILVLVAPGAFPVVAQEMTEYAPDPVVGGTLDPLTIPKYAESLTIPGVMPSILDRKGVTLYTIAAKQIEQQVLPPGFPKTKVFAYGNLLGPGPGKEGNNYSFPAATIEVKKDQPVFVNWTNGLVDEMRNFLPHILPIDQTLHWANPGNVMMEERSQEPYTGPVPIVTHLHGSHVEAVSDGHPEAWYLPAARNIPAGYSTRGPEYGSVLRTLPGSALYKYRNDQRPTTLWYHDHTLGMTRANVYAGLAGFYLIRDAEEAALKLPSGKYEVPILMQDRSFNEDGSLFYPDNRAFFEGLNKPPTEPYLDIPFAPESDIAPIWNPEFFGNTTVVNGKTWPYLNVEKRQYRFRLLNGSDSRFFILKLSNGMPFWQVGSDGGFLPAPVMLDQLLIAPAERMDVIVDFSNVSAGTEIILENIGPDEPFGGGEPGVDFSKANQDTTGQVMKFKVVRRSGKDTSTPVDQLVLPAITPISGTPTTRYLSLNELSSENVFVITDDAGNVVFNSNGEAFGPQSARLGTDTEAIGGAEALPFEAAVTETPTVGATEIWEIRNYTADAHPIHIHQIQFEVVNREFMGVVSPPEPGETGFKDTVIVYPGDEGANPGITRVKVKFDIAGLYIWHCHILSHEDNEMMRPIEVLAP